VRSTRVPIAVLPALADDQVVLPVPGHLAAIGPVGRCEIDVIPTIRAPLERDRPRGWRRVRPVRRDLQLPFGSAYSQV
jgi:hypothetical protein